MGMKKIIDVRDRDEFDRKHIPGTQSIPVADLAERHKELKKDDEIVVVCNHGGTRSHKAAEILKEKGFENVGILEGGMAAWKEGGS